MKKNDLNKELSTKAAIKKKLTKVYKDVQEGFVDQRDRANDVVDYWDIYNTRLNQKQFYSGNSQVYVPIIFNAIEARKTRFTNQIFPQSGRYVNIVSNSGDTPYAHMALMEHYVRKAALRTEVMPQLSIRGDIEGQYNVYVEWKEIKRNITKRVKRGIKVGGMEIPGVDDFDDIETEEVIEAWPDVQVLPDTDVLVMPHSSQNPELAVQNGGLVCILQRMSKEMVQNYIDDGTFVKEAGENLLKSFGTGAADSIKNNKKKIAEAAGVKVEGDKKFALIYQVWMKLKVDGEKKICRIYFGGENAILGCKRNPNWSDKLPILSVPAKAAGVAKGKPLISSCCDMQYAANDVVNQGFDSASYSLLPIVMTDPEKNPRAGTMILDLAAVWECDPNSTKFAEFPKLWQDAFAIVAECKNEIFQTMSINPAMMPNSTGGSGKKRNQAEIATEQQVDILTTADACTILEEGIFTPLLQMFFELDHQHRDQEITVKTYGQLGKKAMMETIEPIQLLERYEFRWLGVETARNVQNIQQQIAMMNVLRGIPKEMMNGKRLDMTPILENAVANAFGPLMAPRILIDEKDELSTSPELENVMLMEGFDVPISPMDDDMKHVQEHIKLLQENGDPTGVVRMHLIKHQASMQKKQMAKMAEQQKQKGMQGSPGGAGPGVAGTPKPGSVPAQPSNVKAPPGSINKDQMVDPSKMPRNM